jgi:hypothetical protein
VIDWCRSERLLCLFQHTNCVVRAIRLSHRYAKSAQPIIKALQILENIGVSELLCSVHIVSIDSGSKWADPQADYATADTLQSQQRFEMRLGV